MSCQKSQQIILFGSEMNFFAMDINMPVVDGIQALRNILQVNPNAKVIMVTSVEQKHIILEAIKLGARDYIVKPFERNMVATVINRVLRSG